MAVLLDQQTQRQHRLSAEVRLGRSKSCMVQVNDRSISSQNTLIRWTERGWEIRDLSSRNGTYLDGRRLQPQERVLLKPGAVVGAGDETERWRLLDASPPVAAADPGSGPLVLASAGMLCLPDTQSPRAILYHTAVMGWIIERDGDIEPAGDSLDIGGRVWTLHLPEAITDTQGSERLSLQGARLRFEVSPDEEFALMSVCFEDTTLSFKSRVHHYLLLTLARLRLDDAGSGRADGGWVVVESLAHMLRIQPHQINLQIHRARQQLADEGVVDPAHIIERGPGRRLRIGFSPEHLSVQSL